MMFGSSYDVKDQRFVREAASGSREIAQANYADDLLAELLERRIPLDGLFEFWTETAASGDSDQVERATVALSHGIRLFLLDLEEAERRARRAGLVCVDGEGAHQQICAGYDPEYALKSEVEARKDRQGRFFEAEIALREACGSKVPDEPLRTFMARMRELADLEETAETSDDENARD